MSGIKSISKQITQQKLWRIQDFPLWGGGAPTSNTYAFWRKRMRKRKNWIMLDGGTCRRRPLDPPKKSINSKIEMKLRSLGLERNMNRQWYDKSFRHHKGKVVEFHSVIQFPKNLSSMEKD